MKKPFRICLDLWFALFSQEKITNVQDRSKAIYPSKGGKEEKIFEALEWLPGMCSHFPNKRNIGMHPHNHEVPKYTV
jgi:hypothetical protein